jgi:hypothetical protein
MVRSRIELGDIFQAHGEAFRRANAGRLSLGQLKVMSAVERCRTAALTLPEVSGQGGEGLARSA